MKLATVRLALHLILLAVLVASGGKKLTMVAYSYLQNWSLVGQVSAQDATTTATPDGEIIVASPTPSLVPVDTVFLKPQQSEQITALLTLYRDQVEKYSKSEREYRTSKAQFEKLTTLQSLEEAIVKTRQAMLDRDDVLITYTELVRAHLQDTQGIEITLKTASDKELETQILELKAHREKVLTSNDRDAIAARAQEFVPISKPIETRITTAVALISLGDLQAVHDKSRLIYAEIRAYHDENPASALREEERQRAYREVESQMENTRLNLESARLKIDSASTANIRKDFSSLYAADSKLLEYLEELLLELT